MSNSNRGGKREGAGRPSLCPNKKKITLTISQETLDLVGEYAKNLSISRSDLIDMFISTYLPDCEDIVKCPKCGKPLVWTTLVPDNGCPCEVTCNNCGASSEVDISENKVL